jgi:hypothetical protein
VTESFVIHPKEPEPGLNIAVRVKDGVLVVTDHLSRRFTFDPARDDGPKKVYGYVLLGSRDGNAAVHWTIVDKEGRSFVDVDKRHWDPDDFRKLAEAAGLALDPEYGGDPSNTEIPHERPDFVDLSGFSGGKLKLGVLAFVFPVLAVVGLTGLLSGFPWFWPLLILAWGGWMIAASIGDALTVQRNRPHLPVDEGGLGLPPDQPGPPLDVRRAMQERNVWRRTAVWGAIAVVPPMIQALR